ncbi:PhzF family phenazine biosynthesis protein [Salinisphaera sp. Q1T1-3]|uniref:PhzF family phenazine biosynthesis protein n=1 Tax=Salinisphaera sp. Q1T1-3 TaxID=2321229 RepID=UPI000E73EA9F|nr:PhzF family phenazine biosynthesis protein [Salinisphaera sp. Q1T1-3]RJS91871.1 PhzF family phenazine biosynthesis protein [Salinisphaera sp. Q1T1-3]
MTMRSPHPLAFHQVDAFTRRVFAGNPAAVYILEDWLDDPTLALIAAEHNLSETAFAVRLAPNRYHLRWFTPSVEVALCGHATLATAHVLLRELALADTPLSFETQRAGALVVHETDGRLWLDLPAYPAEPTTADLSSLAAALGATPSEWRVATNYLAVFDDAATVAALAPDMKVLAPLSADSDRGVIATAAAPADAEYDFVSRYFAPGHGVDEDPVTGSAHCTLAPFWAERLGKHRLAARQISHRGGELACEMVGERVHVGGDAVTVTSGSLYLPTRGARS